MRPRSLRRPGKNHAAVCGITCSMLVNIGMLAYAAGDNAIKFIARVEFGEDIGQNYGTLFEAPTADGRFVLGAGFAGLYNTHIRSDRYAVQFFIRPRDGKRELTTERRPRPFDDVAGAYMVDMDGKLHAFHQSAEDRRLWNEATGTWQDEPSFTPKSMRLGGKMLLFGDSQVEYDGKPILRKPQQGTYHHYYYAQGHLFFYHTYIDESSGATVYKQGEGFTKLYACPWRPDSDRPIDVSQATVLTLPFRETPFAWGQLGAGVLTCSNIGGLYIFDGQAWKTLVKAVMNTSYQIYSMLNYYDRLLMGHYPTGLLYEFDGNNVTLLEGWPPRLEGVSPNAREAQTTAIYGGDLFVGVWPWGELWRYSPDAKQWSSAGRMFTHPLTYETTHPYEKECIEKKIVSNQLGQRVTSLVPIGDSLMISTSAKYPCKWASAFDFLGDDKRKEYGSVVRLRTPGHLSAPVRWKQATTQLEFVISGDDLRIVQDGEELASGKIGAALAAAIAAAPNLEKTTWGQGVFGKFTGASLKGQVETAKAARPKRARRP